MQAMIEDSTEEHRGKRHRQGKKIVVRHSGYPEAGHPIARHAEGAGRKKIGLQCGAKMLRRPASHRSVDDKRRTVHSIGSAQCARTESAENKPSPAIALELKWRAADPGVAGKA